jgi:hypothetical protein
MNPFIVADIVSVRTGLAGLDSFSAFEAVPDESLTNLPVRKARKHPNCLLNRESINGVNVRQIRGYSRPKCVERVEDCQPIDGALDQRVGVSRSEIRRP